MIKNKKLLGLIIVVACFVVALANIVLFGCSQGSSSSTTSSSSFYTNAANTTPVFKPASVSASSATSEWGSGNPLYTAYYCLREFLASRDEGSVDRSNLYKLLIDVDSVISGVKLKARAITTQEVTSPFASLQKIICDQASNEIGEKRAIALTETENQIKAIVTWIWSDSAAKNEYGIAAVKFNKLTQEITLEATYSVDYDLSDTKTDYNLRCYATGNVATNTFEFKYIVDGNRVVAKGVSRGSGNYMLFKYAGYDNEVKYIVVPGTADEGYFSAQNSSLTQIYSSPDALPASVEAYKTWVVNTDFFTTSELVSDLNQLNVGNSRAGTIYINYQ